MAHDVFISYASEDKSVADAVCATLESRGIRCWIAPRDVLPGLHYGEAIIDAIRECRIMVLVFSSKANLSGHIPKEIERAVSQGSTIMPLRIEDVVPAKSLDYFIGGVHWLDALTPPIEAHLQRLAGNVKTLLSRNVSAAPVSPTPVGTAPPLPSTTPLAAAPHAARAGRPVGSYAIIAVLVAVILGLGFLVLRSNSPGRVVTEQTNAPLPAQPIVPPAVRSSATAASPVSVGAAMKFSAPATLAARPDQPAKLAAPPKPASTPAKISAAAAHPPNSDVHSANIVFRNGPGATIKLAQLLGDQDNERHQPTLNQTVSRYGIEGSSLGYSFEHQGRAYFLFDDIVGRALRWPDAIATTDSTDPDAQVPLDFLSGVRGQYLHIQPEGLNMGLNAGPVAGISLGGQMYVVVRTNDPRNRTTENSVLTKFVAPSTFQALRTISELPDGHFLKMSLHEQTGSAAGLPPGGPYVFMWGTGAYRESDAYLAIVAVAQFESGMGARYFAGLSDSGAPLWSDKESDAKPVVKDGTLGDLSVTWCKDLGLWLMTYDRRTAPNGIVFSYSQTPWGPWSEPQLVFNMIVDGALGKYIHNPYARPSDGLAGPVLLPRNQGDRESLRGAAYAPYVVERWTKRQGSELDIYYTMSTLNPYVVVLMKSRFQVE